MGRKSHILFSERKVGISLKCRRPGVVAKRLSNSSCRIMGNLEVTHFVFPRFLRMESPRIPMR